jgi:hypothetical protein
VEDFNSDITEDKPTFFFFHFQRTGSTIVDPRRGALLFDLRHQRTTKATGSAQRHHFFTLALALAQRSRCKHFFFLRLMRTNPSSSHFTADNKLSNLKQETE